MKKIISQISEESVLILPKLEGETDMEHVKRLLVEGIVTRKIFIAIKNAGQKGWNELLDELGLEESVRPKTNKAVDTSFFNDWNIKEVQSLAETCLESAAGGENPQIFWGVERYGVILQKCITYIKAIGLNEARQLFEARKLDFPTWVFD
jgi:hypothetical protein